MTDLGLLALGLAVLAVTGLLLRERYRLRRAASVQLMLQTMAPSPVEALPLPPRTLPLLADPNQADAWVLATPDGRCMMLNDHARTVFGLDRDPPAVDYSLSGLLHNGSTEARGILREIALRSLLASRSVAAASKPSDRLEIAGVALRDRVGNLWGAALFIRPLPRAVPTSPSLHP